MRNAGQRPSTALVRRLPLWKDYVEGHVADDGDIFFVRPARFSHGGRKALGLFLLGGESLLTLVLHATPQGAERGQVEKRRRITRAMLRAEPETLFLFGDNMARTGLGGQAAEMRGEPNAVGIPTKHRPSNDASAFFSDDDFRRARMVIEREFERVRAHLAEGGNVVVPADGLGTGLADLPRRAPKIFAHIQKQLAALDSRATGGEYTLNEIALYRSDMPEAPAWRGQPFALRAYLRDGKTPRARLTAFKTFYIAMKKAEWTVDRTRLVCRDPLLASQFAEFLTGEATPLDQLVSLYEAANSAYHTGQAESPLTDAQFDALKDYLAQAAPKRVAPTKVGAPVVGEKVTLPKPMGSLDKIKPDRGAALRAWAQKVPAATLLVSPKIDGISLQIVYESGKLAGAYTRGDGFVGKLVLHHARQIPDIPQTLPRPLSMIVRAEAVMAKKTFDKTYAKTAGGGFANPRNMIAGVFNRKDALDQKMASHINVVAYEIMDSARHAKDAQLRMLNSFGFRVVPVQAMRAADLAAKAEAHEKKLVAQIGRLRTEFPYEIDGLVVEVNEPEIRRALGNETNSINPRFARAFKADDTNQAVTTVREVVWTPSKHGYLKPTIVVDPVLLSGASVSRATAFNAAFVRDNRIAPGAEVTLTRSGDVIPFIVNVVRPAVAWAKPDVRKFGKYDWNATGVDLVMEDGDHDDVAVQRILHFFRTAQVESFSEGLIKRFYENGFTSVYRILAAKPADFLRVPGIQQKTADKIHTNIRARLDNIPLPRLMDASGAFGRLIGETRLRRLHDELGEDIYFRGARPQDIIRRVAAVPGFSEDSAKQFADGLMGFRDFLSTVGQHVTVAKPKKINGPMTGITITPSGFRDAAMNAAIEAKGGRVSDSLTRQTTLLVTNGAKSSKMDKAVKLGVRIMALNDFRKKYGV